ncbi:MAG: ribosome small subunit-dependent GTPase A [Bacteroidota bacterium]
MQGIVTKSTGSWCTVRQENDIKTNCIVKGILRISGIKSTNPVAVGDNVVFDILNDGTGLISEILERKNYIIRKATKLSKRSHIIAANIDRAFLMITLVQPPTTTLFIDRFLVTAEAYHIPVDIIINKIEIYTGDILSEMKKLTSIYEQIGFKCHKISALKDQNIGGLRDLFRDKINLLSGNSGVGKSTLINTLDPNLNLKIGKISSYHKKGTHTTAFAEMLELHSGGYIIDTPGIKSFGVIDIEKEELSHYFPEMRNLLHYCQYHNCCHINEPNCAVIKALEKGEIAKSRYRNYIDIYDSDDGEAYRQKGY